MKLDDDVHVHIANSDSSTALRRIKSRSTIANSTGLTREHPKKTQPSLQEITAAILKQDIHNHIRSKMTLLFDTKSHPICPGSRIITNSKISHLNDLLLRCGQTSCKILHRVYQFANPRRFWSRNCILSKKETHTKHIVCMRMWEGKQHRTYYMIIQHIYS